MPISTKNIDDTPISGDFPKSVLEPGNYSVKINSIALRDEKNPEFGSKLVMFLETSPVTDPRFKGILRVKDHPEQGVYAGKVGYVSLSKWGYKDFVTSNGSTIEKSLEILKAIKNLCRELKILKWWDDQPFAVETHDELAPLVLNAFVTQMPFKDIYFNCCIAGKKYKNKQGYDAYDMFFPQADTLRVPYSLNAEKVQKFFHSVHIEESKPKTEPSSAVGVIGATGGQKAEEKAAQNESAADFLAEINKPVEQTYHKDAPANQPVYPKVTSQAEANFLNDRPQIKTEKITESPFTESIMNDEPSTSGIVTSQDQDPLPWEL